VIGPFVKRARQSVLARNAGWFFAGQGLSFVVQGFYFIVLARLLGTTQYGLLAGAVALVAIALRKPGTQPFPLVLGQCLDVHPPAGHVACRCDPVVGPLACGRGQCAAFVSYRDW
jgi:hypothetical protein